MSSALGASRAHEARLILASASPRRRALLEAAGLRFEVEPSGALEDYPADWSPEEVALRLAERKACAVAGRHPGERAWVLGADTVVALEVGGRTRLLEKPRDEAEAREMLELLSGSRHRVVTGVAVHPCARDGRATSAFERTWVRMRPILSAEIEGYVRSGEWRDKAGGYAIQEKADAFVVDLAEGGFDNVVGLPVALALRLLRECGAALPAR